MHTAKVEMATPGQVELIREIASELANPPRDIDTMVSMLTKRTAGRFIEMLKYQPRKWDGEPLAEGFYHYRGRVYRVARSELGRPYAVRLFPDGSEKYAPGVIRMLKPRMAL